ncbi:hypothetical protein ACTMTI_39620 [Nonomuraea sp. H19]|uniref:hypothetical protein n=1 Tax=Nonomuraea sp. H19 TaxID=3452206 RepID=UPI003F89EA2D
MVAGKAGEALRRRWPTGRSGSTPGHRVWVRSARPVTGMMAPEVRYVGHSDLTEVLKKY